MASRTKTDIDIDDEFEEITKTIKKKASELRAIDKKISKKMKKATSVTIEEKKKIYNITLKDLHEAFNKLLSLNENYYVDTVEEEEAGFKRGSKRTSFRVSGRKREQANLSRDRSNEQEETVHDENQEHDRSWSKKRSRRHEKPVEIDDITLQEQPRQQLDRSQSLDKKKDRQKFDLNKHVNELQGRVQELERELKSHKEETQTYKEENAKLKKQNVVLNQEKNVARTSKSLGHKTGKQHSDLNAYTNELQERVLSLQQELESQKKKTQTYEKDNTELRRHIDVLNQEKNSARTRLSQLGSSKLPDNNPNIADLSDVNRPTKIAEQYSELYDNEWADAYSTLESTNTDKECCMILLDVIKNIYDECRQLANDRFFERVQHCIESPNQTYTHIDEIEMSDFLKQEVKELRKKRAPKVIGSIKKFVVPKIQTKEAATETMQAYMNKCTELCWLMAVQDPPLVLTFQSEPPSQFDEKMFRAYTSRGKYVDFYVWPMMTYTDGTLLAKGVAQGSSTMRAARKLTARNSSHITK